jgi:16S rRNA (guanine527-N7)-methyltransferase
MEKKRKALIDEFIVINSHTNLSAIRDPEGIQIKHIQDSLEINKVLVLKPGSTLCDVGTGGGFPLLPIAINNPEIQCIGIDSTKKKVDAINEMIGKLKIPNAQAIRTRAEEYNKKTVSYPEGFDYVTARAVGYIDKLLPRVHHLVKKGGRLVLYKQYTSEESQDIIHFGKRYRFVVQKKHKYQLFEGDIQRIIYVLKKI